MAELIKAGVCKDIITPPIGTSLAGYAFEKQPSLGVHDQLWVRAVVLQNSTTIAALAMVDVIGFDAYLIDRVKMILKNKTVIPEENIVLGATHTHAALPTISTGPRGPDGITAPGTVPPGSRGGMT